MSLNVLVGLFFCDFEHPKKGADGDDITSWVMFEDIYQPDSSKESSPTNSWGSPSWPSKAQTSPWVSCCLAYDVELLRLLLQVRKKRSGGRHKTWGYGHGIMGKQEILPSGYLTQPWKDPPFVIGKPSINGPFSMAMLNNQRVLYISKVFHGAVNHIFKQVYRGIPYINIYKWDIFHVQQQLCKITRCHIVSYSGDQQPTQFCGFENGWLILACTTNRFRGI